MDTELFFREIMPRMEDYGRYALAMQKGVFSKDKELSESDAENALTDADFMVEEGLLRFFLEKKYNFRILAEEDSPYVDKFSKEGDMLVVMDPIDGTLRYKKGFENFGMIISVFKKGILDGTLLHTPYDEKFYWATQENEIALSGFYHSDKLTFSHGGFGISSIGRRNSNIIKTNILPEDKEKIFNAKGLTINQSKKDNRDFRFGLNSILTEEIDG